MPITSNDLDPVFATSDSEVETFLERGDAVFVATSVQGDHYLCTSSPDGDLWAMRYANEDEIATSPILVLFQDLGLPLQLQTIAAMPSPATTVSDRMTVAEALEVSHHVDRYELIDVQRAELVLRLHLQDVEAAQHRLLDAQPDAS